MLITVSRWYMAPLLVFNAFGVAAEETHHRYCEGGFALILNFE